MAAVIKLIIITSGFVYLVQELPIMGACRAVSGATRQAATKTSNCTILQVLKYLLCEKNDVLKLDVGG